ncbi:putative WRKY transcription factor 14 [Citrus sinensis]|nr:putative WRKY transcription factor 14 [Citrus sinensis]
MENYQGDLTDIIRAGGRQIGSNNSASVSASSSSASVVSASDHLNNPLPTWQFPSDPLSFCSSIDDNRENLFGDPFSNTRDPLLHELNIPNSSGYYAPPPLPPADRVVDHEAATAASNINIGRCHHHQRGLFHEDELKSPCNIFSRIQISPSSQSPKQQPAVSPCESPVIAAAAAAAASPRGIKAPVVVASDMINANSTSKSCLVDNTGPAQISSPRNLGIKRRKSQAKKVVCIPAPAAANSRSSGEVVPSDLWAWRKYGQKPIKGSPYPRGYYRCSSSKGCSARKQVERSRTDPNMLVITYTSEHNHPWPTQRNALAGSTRSQPSKANAAAKGSVSPSSHQPPQNTTTNNSNTKENVKDSSNDTTTLSPSNNNFNAAPSSSTSVKEEIEEIEKPIDDDQMEGADLDEFSEGFSNSNEIYKPALPDSNQSHEDFFADLGEIEADPLNLLFSQGFSTGDHENKGTRVLDPFNIFDWSGDNNNNNSSSSNTSFGETKRGL